MSTAERMAGVEVGSVYCGIAGEHVAGRSSHGMVSVTSDEIRTGDVARVNDMASNVSFGRDHELLHAIPQDYIIDQQPGITEPIGMTGSRLEAEVYLVTVLSSVLSNLKRCVERAGYHVGEFVVEPLAASLAVLTPDERELGCALVELGAGSTNVAIFQGGKIRHTSKTRRSSRSGSAVPTSRWCRRATSSSCRARRVRGRGAPIAAYSRTSCTSGWRKYCSSRWTR
jgi:cell division protein FtsA